MNQKRRMPRTPLAALLILALTTGCGHDEPAGPPPLGGARAVAAPEPTDGTAQMVAALEELAVKLNPGLQTTIGYEARVAHYQRQRDAAGSLEERARAEMLMGYEYLAGGRSQEALDTFTRIGEAAQAEGRRIPQLAPLAAAAYLRLGEDQNCLAQHGPESCILPIRGSGVHKVRLGSENAATILQAILTENPGDLGSRWLLNLAHMTLGDYPEGVPEQWRIAPETWASEGAMPRFTNVAARLGVDVLGLAGGSVMEDLDGDGDLDLMASDWAARGQLRVFENRGDGSFRDVTESAGLLGLVGGLNMCHADYDGDGDADVLVLRGAWAVREAGRQPNSLLRNNGDLTFSDVTVTAGLLSLHPTQTAAWSDIDGDGRLDLFIGNESLPGWDHPCELYMGAADGTFTDQAADAGIAHVGFVKGVAAGDYDGDGRPDLYLSRHGQPNLLFHNETADGEVHFREVGVQAGVSEPENSFPTWFWDYDNDGSLDLFVAPFPSFTGDHLGGIAADTLGLPCDLPRAHLYRGRGDGTFEDVSERAGLSHAMLAMGANYEDVDGDGFLDLYIGTGEPNLTSLVPNRMYRNDGGERFRNVTTAAGVGHVQKGHGIAFGDIDNDGDQDIYAVMGGAFQGDVAYNALFLNPGSGNRWITLDLEGVTCNRDAIGARIVVTVDSEGGARKIYRTVGTGGSFGSSSLQQEIGLGDARGIESVEVMWPGGATQTLSALELDRSYRIREGDPAAVPLTRSVISFE